MTETMTKKELEAFYARPEVVPEVRLTFVSPEDARKYLANNPVNRAQKRGGVTLLKKQILTGKWQATHQAVAVMNNGEIIDGQHRLQAIVEADVGVWLMLCTNASSSWRPLIDVGDRRTVSDFVVIKSKERGIDIGVNSKNLTSLAGMVLLGPSSSDKSDQDPIARFAMTYIDELRPFVRFLTASKSSSWARKVPVIAPFAAFDIFHNEAKGRGMKWLDGLAEPNLSDHANPLTSYANALLRFRGVSKSQTNTNRTIRSATRHPSRFDIYLMGVSVISALAEGRSLTRIFVAKGEFEEVLRQRADAKDLFRSEPTPENP